MNKVWRRVVGITLLPLALLGCAEHVSAPVSDVGGGKYDNISRGSYRGNYYVVEKGDTLYFISYVTNKDVKELISLNKLSPPYTIHPGQRLNLWRPVYKAPTVAPAAKASVSTAAAATATASAQASNASTKPKTSSQPKAVTTAKKPVEKSTTKGVANSKTKEYGEAKGKQNVNYKAPVTPKPTANTKVSKWIWPTKGRVIKNFSAGNQGNKGIDIAGQRGQAIIATAGGTVVYSGNALRGYGNLVIVKHNDSYLSAYAHNDRLLVTEGQSVKAGQKIATMGSSGTSSVRLHFEIRYKGKSVNPKRYLP
ncbi:murein hydrolase activator NlpD [Vibrio hippocampi]|uniref:Murein hydrolase activator NlpD n=1 Tax=Vibrio hippocampi TaxID=654686 RepID=A0ABM8ZJQ4_9VIBR|nr:murein hydrolase activator NlpD [Vibrio hippocampi]CAH0527119.1 Murein hydrolase activator NlpD [Vibrio hippocampi]